MSEHNGHHGERAIDEILAIPVPPGWMRTSIANVGEVRLGRQRSPKNRSLKYPTKYLRAANLTWGGIDLSDVLDMEFRPTERATYRLQPGDVLLSEASGSATEVGKPAIWNGELEECCFQNTVIRFRPNAVDSRFALITFQHFARNGVFSKVSKGVGIHHLSADRFASMPFLLPPKNEQARIVEKIEELFSDLDAGVAALERAKANLKRYRASILKAAVEGKLTAAWRADHKDLEPASKLLERILAERRRKWEADQLAKFAAAGKPPLKNWRAKYVEAAPPDTTNLPELPKGWNWTTIDTLLREPLRNGHSARASSDGSGIRTLTLTAVTYGDFSLENTKLTVADPDHVDDLWIEPGDIFIERSNTPELVGTARLYRGPSRFAVFPDLLIRVRVAHETCDSFIDVCLQSRLVRGYFHAKAKGLAGSMPKIDQAAIQRCPIPFPPLEEQRQIAAEVAAKLSTIEAADVAIDHGLHRAARLRQSILKRAFEGKLVPQDPRDEPASVLLERIHTNRTSPMGSEDGKLHSRMRRSARARTAAERG